MSQSVNCSSDSIDSKDFSSVFVTGKEAVSGFSNMSETVLTIGNVHRAAHSGVLVEQDDAAHYHANLLQRLQPIVRLERGEVLEVVLAHDGVERVRDFGHHLKVSRDELN